MTDKSAPSTETTEQRDYDYDEEEEPDRTCSYCSGTGGDPWNDGILPCPECDGEGYRWWE